LWQGGSTVVATWSRIYHGVYYLSDATHTTFSVRYAYDAQPQNNPWCIDAVGHPADAGLTDSDAATSSRTKIVHETSCVRHFRYYFVVESKYRLLILQYCYPHSRSYIFSDLYFIHVCIANLFMCLCPYVFIRENTTLPHKLVLEFTSQPKTLILLWLAVWTMQPIQNTHPQTLLPTRHRHCVCASLFNFPPLNLKLNHQALRGWVGFIWIYSKIVQKNMSSSLDFTFAI
jgi:hypothetical protein